MNWPYLRLYLDLGFLSFRTHVMCFTYEELTFDYIGLRWSFFKWSGEFRLYTPVKPKGRI